MYKSLICQPYVTKLKIPSNTVIFISRCCNSGLRPGDAVSVYRTKQVFDRNQQSRWQLTDTKIFAVVKQVQPDFSIAELLMDARMLNVQMDDVVFAW